MLENAPRVLFRYIQRVAILIHLPEPQHPREHQAMYVQVTTDWVVALHTLKRSRTLIDGRLERLIVHFTGSVDRHLGSISQCRKWATPKTELVRAITSLAAAEDFPAGVEDRDFLTYESGALIEIDRTVEGLTELGWSSRIVLCS